MDDFDQWRKRQKNRAANALSSTKGFKAKSKTTRIETTFLIVIKTSSITGFKAKSKTTRIETAACRY